MHLAGKRLMFLGGADFQVPAIERANELGVETICVDNRPENPGHAAALKSHSDVSTVCIAEVFGLARSESVDGIIGYGTDVAARTVSHVARELMLYANPEASIQTLTQKDEFRSRLGTAGIQAIAFHEIVTKPTFHASESDLPVIVKPVDASGSKGVTRVRSLREMRGAIERALTASRTGQAIVETFVEKLGPQICGDGYFQDGQIAFVEYGDGHFVPGSFAPIAESFPSVHDADTLRSTTLLLEKTLNACGYERGPFNLDVIIDKDRQPFIVEIGPRSGGNYIPQIIQHRIGVDLVDAAIRTALDPKFRLFPRPTPSAWPCVAGYMLQSATGGVFGQLRLSDRIQEHLLSQTLHIRPGAVVEPFVDGSNTFGNLIMGFETTGEMAATISEMNMLVSWSEHSHA